MDAIITQIVASAPFAAIFLLIAKTIYDDWKIDRKAASEERTATLGEIRALSDTIKDLARQLDALRYTIEKTPAKPLALNSGDRTISDVPR